MTLDFSQPRFYLNAEGRWRLDFAQAVAEDIRARLADACERIEVAGSIRREKPWVGDVELLYVPKYSGAGLNLAEARICSLQDRFPAILSQRLLRGGRTNFGPLNKLMLHCQTRMAVDLFSTSTRNWGMALLVRTGPKEFNIQAMMALRRKDLKGHAYGGVTDAEGQEIDCPDEETVFRLLGLGWIPPREREGLSRRGQL